MCGTKPSVTRWPVCGGGSELFCGAAVSSEKPASARPSPAPGTSFPFSDSERPALGVRCPVRREEPSLEGMLVRCGLGAEAALVLSSPGILECWDPRSS